MGLHEEYQQPLLDAPNKPDSQRSRWLPYGVRLMNVLQNLVALGTALTFGRAAYYVRAVLLDCAGECVLQSDQTIQADNLLSEMLVLYILATITAAVVSGISLYHVAQQLLTNKTTSCKAVNSNAKTSGASRSSGSPSNARDIHICLAVLVCCQLAVLRMWPLGVWCQCFTDALALTAVNIVAMYTTRTVENLVMEMECIEQGDEQEQFLLGGDV